MQKKLENNPTFLFVVAAALIDLQGHILVQQRPEGKNMAGLWEFPGGKVEAGEPTATALARELKEELGISVVEGDLTPATFASEPLDGRHLILLLYICKKWSGKVQNLESPDMAWLPLEDLYDLAMPPADVPLVEQLSKLLR